MLDTDAEEYRGQSRLDHNIAYHTFPEPWDNRSNHIFVSSSFYFYINVLFINNIQTCFLKTMFNHASIKKKCTIAALNNIHLLY